MITRVVIGLLAGRARRHPVGATLVAGLGAIHLAEAAGLGVCPRASTAECLLAAALLVAGASLTGIIVRAL